MNCKEHTHWNDCQHTIGRWILYNKHIAHTRGRMRHSTSCQSPDPHIAVGGSQHIPAAYTQNNKQIQHSPAQPQLQAHRVERCTNRQRHASPCGAQTLTKTCWAIAGSAVHQASLLQGRHTCAHPQCRPAGCRTTISLVPTGGKAAGHPHARPHIQQHPASQGASCGRTHNCGQLSLSCA